ncbi:MAG: hypothetical protein WCR07_01665 [Verrucomicrobiota bacterium]|jgi:hypothetical protein
MRNTPSLPRLAGPWLAMVALAAAGSLAAGETMRESGPSTPKGAIGRNGKPSDPLLDRLVNPSQLKPGRDDSSLVNPFMTPRPNAGAVDPLLQKQWNREIEKQRNWLLENATRIADPDKPRIGREPERGLPNLKDRLEAESPASVRYLQARDAALSGAARRSPVGGTEGLGSPNLPDPATSSFSQDTDRRNERPLDTSRIVQLGGDASAATGGRVAAHANGFTPGFRDGANPGPAGTPGVLDEARKNLMEERNSAFDALLAPPPSTGGGANAASYGTSGGGSTPANPDPLSIVGIEPRGSTTSRSRQFEALLGGTDASPGNPSPNTARALTTVLPGPSRNTGLPDISKPAGLPTASREAKPATRQPERRFQPQPAILELPRFNQ